MSASDPTRSPLDRLSSDRLSSDRPALDRPPVHEPATSFQFWGRDRGAFGRPPGVRWFERLRDDPRIGVAALLATALVAGVLWYRIGIDAADEPVGASTTSPATEQVTPSTTRVAARADGAGGPEPAGGEDGGGGGGETEPAGGDVVVHVAGAVVRPGIVRLHTGDRVVDALEGAGGAVPGAALDQLNLAAKVADGQWIGVGLPGQALVAPGSASAGGAAPGGTAAGTDGLAGTAGLVNLNTATQAEVELLPGIGPVLGAAILRERDERGGFRSVDELRSVRGIGEKRFADLRDLVTV